jgi:DNA polymerase III subunit gamma/tau
VGWLDSAWPAVRASVRESSRTVEVMLSEAQIVAAEGDEVVLAHAVLAQRLSDSRHVETLRAAIRAVTGRDVRLRWQSAPAAKPASPPPAKRPATQTRFTRPSRASDTPAPAHEADDVPPPPEPDYPDDPPDPGPPPSPTPAEEREMLDEARRPAPQAQRVDPEQAAIALLQSELGARRIN